MSSGLPGERLTRAYSEIVEWEGAEGIYEYRIDGVPLWRLIRNTTIINASVRWGLENAHRVSSVTAVGVVALARGYLRSVGQLAAVPSADLLFWGTGRRHKTDDGFLSPLIDPIIDQLPQFKSVLFERPLTGKHHQPATTRNLIWYDAPKVHARVRAQFANSLPEKQQNVVEGLAQLIAKRFPMQRTQISRRLQVELAAFRNEKMSAARILTKAKPKAVLLTNRWVNCGVIAACRELGVSSYEIQHGAIGKGGFKYRTPYCPAIDPDGLLVLAREWLSRDWGMPQDRVHNIGAPFIWSERERIQDVVRGSRIMLISQPNLSSALNIAFEEICEAFPEQKFLLKLHPQDRHQVAGRYPVSLLPNVELADEGRSLYECFCDCQAVIGQDSTALLEASFFGLKVGLLNLSNAIENSFRERIGNHNFFSAESTDEVASMLASTRTNEALDGNGYFDAFKAANLTALLAGAS